MAGNIYVSSEEKFVLGRGQRKNNLHVLPHTNATGLHKLTPLVTGKAKNPWNFKNSYAPSYKFQLLVGSWNF